jgi:hypothetical protein
MPRSVLEVMAEVLNGYTASVFKGKQYSKQAASKKQMAKNK